MGAFHPECPERLHAISDRMIASGMEMLVTHYDAPEATLDQLARVHDRTYIARIFAAAPKDTDALAWLDGDTAMNRGTLPAALRSAGAAILAVDLVMSDKHHAAFCCVRPPGHHAGRDSAAGFCFFNNVAVAAAHALEHHGLTRVAIVDFDVHHGNGTEDIFTGEPRVLFCSSFQHPFYPGTGADTVEPNIINLAMPRLTSGTDFRAAVTRAWLPRLDAFAPQMIFISAGFDAHRDDELGQMGLVEADYAWITRQLKSVAQRHAQGRIVSCLEGGYQLDALARSVEAHVRALAGV